MLHSQIENEEIIERYVRNQLAPKERQAFEEHFLSCEECFEELQTTERFLAGILDAAQHGLLDDQPRAASRTWLTWALAATTCIALVFVAVTLRRYHSEVAKLRGELWRVTVQLQTERRSRAESDQKTTEAEQAEANVPLVMLQASRGREEPEAALLQPTAKHLVLWIEFGPSRYREFRLEVFSQQNRLIASLEHLQRGSYGALSASLPADQLPTGDFRIRLTGQDPPPASLVGEYHLRIRRP